MVRITVLSENTVGVPAGVVGEWGLSLLVESGGSAILFDTGAAGHVVENAKALGVDLSAVEALCMSHGHYDHSGGMMAFLRLVGRLPVYAHPDFFAAHHSTAGDKYIGVPFDRARLSEAGADFVFTSGPREILPGLWVSGEVPRRTNFEAGDPRLFIYRDGEKVPDPFVDDMSLYCVTPKGLLIILGCAHAGVVNIVRHAQEVTGQTRVYGLFGGTHLGNVGEVQREQTIAYLQTLSLQFLAANHCTGLPMMTRLAGLFGSAFHFAPVGARFELPL
jgi:7,8-dihydropterin-6-yl-methyl-4-(beta-D-ribofuranosyl)aminobenzene 5'-phosphate synthase